MLEFSNLLFLLPIDANKFRLQSCFIWHLKRDWSLYFKHLFFTIHKVKWSLTFPYNKPKLYLDLELIGLSWTQEFLSDVCTSIITSLITGDLTLCWSDLDTISEHISCRDDCILAIICHRQKNTSLTIIFLSWFVIHSNFNSWNKEHPIKFFNWQHLSRFIFHKKEFTNEIFYLESLKNNEH